LTTSNQAIPADLTLALDRFADVRHFYVPLEGTGGEGQIVATLPGENPYDFGIRGNWNLVMGKGLSWLLPWKAMRRKMGNEVFNWPVSPKVKARLVAEAESRLRR
jgi:hypothetical protein